MKTIINCETGEIIERELNFEELQQQKIDEENFIKIQKEQMNNEIIQTAKRQAVLDRLGITEEEARLLLA